MLLQLLSKKLPKKPYGSRSIMPLISVVAPCYDEEGNVEELHQRLSAVFAQFPTYEFELIFIDNCSTDGTVNTIKNIIERDKRVRLIVNARNFGHIRSPYYGLLQAHGAAAILIATDLEDPPELVADFIRLWEKGYRIVVGVKDGVEESKLFHAMRGAYYRLLSLTSEDPVIDHYHGFGLYDKSVIELLRDNCEPYPYMRGMIAAMGYDIAKVPFYKPSRKRGFSKNNLYTLYDNAMLGITSQSRVPLRLAIFLGFACGFLSFIIAFIYLIMKLIYWQNFTAGQAPMLIGMAFLGSIQLFFIGLIGEYLLAINTRTQKRPLVVERERVNF